jgi:hypothetical protein
MALEMPDLKGNKKVYLWVGGAAVLFVGYRWYQSRQVAATAAATPTDTTMGTGSVTDAAGGAYGPGNVQYGGADITAPTETPKTNAQWSNAAVTALVNQGWDGMTVQTALGRFLTDASLDTGQETIVRAAIGAVGNPPQGAHTIIHMPTPTPSPTPTPGAKYGPISGPPVLSLGAVTRTSIRVTWQPLKNATAYHETLSGGGVNKAQDTTATYAYYTGLKPNTTYTFHVYGKTPESLGATASKSIKTAK